MRAMACVVACVPPSASPLAAQAKKPSPSGSLGWVEAASKRRARNSDRNEANELLSESSCFGLVGLVFVRLGRASWLKKCDRGHHDLSWDATAGVGCSTVCRRGRGHWHDRVSLRFEFYRLDRRCRSGQKSWQARVCCPTANMPP